MNHFNIILLNIFFKNTLRFKNSKIFITMRPFIISLLKCTKCGSTNIPKLNPIEIKKTVLPAHIPQIDNFKNEQILLLDLIESICKVDGSILDITEADAYNFTENEISDESTQKIIELLYGIDVIKGNVVCTDCGEEKDIRNSILFCENK